MSINITVHGNKLEAKSRKNVLGDPEYLRKEQLIERRKQRLEQVRQQSKEVAQQVRRNVDDEIKRQEGRISEQKRKELLEWREKALAEAKRQQYKSPNGIGSAHEAAMEERLAHEKCSEEKKRLDDAAKTRGKAAILKEKTKTATKKTNPVPKIKTPKARKKNNENCSKIANRSNLSRPLTDIEEISSDSTSSSLSSEVSRNPKPTLKENAAIIMDVNTDSDDSSISMSDSHKPSNRHYYRTTEKSGSTGPSKSSYNAHDYRQSDTSSSRTNSIEENKPVSKQFSKISDFLQKRKMKSNSPAATLDFPAATEQSITPTKSCLKSKQQTQTVPSIKSIPKSAKTPAKPRSEASNSVQFYDYDNKYARKYEQGQNMVEKLPKPNVEINAMERARLELQAQELQKEKTEEMRRKSDARCKIAMEREQVRKDCKLLTQQLEALNRNFDVVREVDERERVNVFPRTFVDISQPKHVNQPQMTRIDASKPAQYSTFTKTKADKSQSVQKKEINTSEKTAREKKTVASPGKTTIHAEENVPATRLHRTAAKSDQAPPNSMNQSHEINTSDSCASILLEYVNKQSEQISNDIKECGNADVLKDLKSLLEKINHTRGRILSEIKQQEAQKEQFIAKSMKDIAQSICDLRRERESILLEERKRIESIKTNLDKRERHLKAKEKQLEQKLQEIIERKVDSKSNRDFQGKAESQEKLIGQNYPLQATAPIEIVIKVRNETSGKFSKSPYKSPRKRSSLLPDFKHVRRKNSVLVKRKSSNEVDQVSEKPTEHKEAIEVSPAKSRSSTSYMSLPEAVHTKLGELLSNPIEREVGQTKEATESKKEPATYRSPTKAANADAKKKNPVLMHYIQRLLGMSRSSIDMLGVSSSEIGTPTSSIVANPTNMSPSEESLPPDRLHNLQEFINENYSFINELEESMRSSKSSRSTASSTDKMVEIIWRNALRQERDGISSANLEKQIKSILKKKAAKVKTSVVPLKPSVEVKQKKSAATQVSDVSKSDKSIEVTLPQEATKPSIKVTAKRDTNESLDPNEMVGKYSQLTENCTKRIAELTNMINKVRKEKQKILEITLTSGSETGPNSTEYLELPEGCLAKSDEDTSRGLELKRALDAPVESERANLERNKLTGVSRDSGISMSRPVTALDSHDSSEQRGIGKTTPDYQQQSPITLAPQKAVTPVSAASAHDTPVDSRKQHKPPVTITRYSPQIIEEPPHELSTIMEVETPITSRLNTSIPDKNIASITVEATKSIKTAVQFPTYEEYIATHNLQISQFIDVDASSKVEVDPKDQTITSDNTNLKYKEFPSMRTYLQHEVTKQTETSMTHSSEHEQSSSASHSQSVQTAEVLGYKRFPSHQSYIKTLGATGLLDSQSIDAVSVSDESTPSNQVEESESTESLPDVVAELKKRKILQHSFRNEAAGEKFSSTSSSDHHNLQIASTSTATPPNTSPSKSRSKNQSPVKKKVQVVSHERLEKSPHKGTGKVADLTGIERLPSTSSSLKGTSESLENELDKMGLKWASVMLRKSQQSMDLGSTSSSFTYQQPRRKSPKKTSDKSRTSALSQVDSTIRTNERTQIEQPRLVADQSSDDSDGKAFNLKEFFTKELQKRAATSLSMSSTDDSIASQFIKSLLGSANSTPVLSSDAKSALDRRHHTSTPVLQRRTSSSSKSLQESSKLFSGESCISSVRFSSASSHDPDALNASHLKLDISKRQRSKNSRDNDKDS